MSGHHLGIGKTARFIPCTKIFLSDSPQRACCFCGSRQSEFFYEDEKLCFNCKATLVLSDDPITEIEAMTIQIYRLKVSIAFDWNMDSVLFPLMAAFYRGEKPEWPKAYGHGPQQWVDNNYSKGKMGHEIAAVTQDHWSYVTHMKGGKHYP